MSTWPTQPLGSVAAVNDGDWIETKDQGGSAYRLLQISNIGVGRFRETGNYRFVTQETFDRLHCHEVEPGMVLIARMPDPTGRAWHVKRLPWRAITAVDVAIVEPDRSVLDPAFLAHCLNSPRNLARIAKQSSGTTRARITRRELTALEVPVPPLDVQRRVVAILDGLEELIESSARRVQLLEAMVQAIFQEWFVRFRAPRGSGDDGATSSDLPGGWTWCSLKDAAKWTSGGTPSTKNPSYWDGDIPWITSGSLRSFLLDDSVRRLTSEGLKAGSRLIPRDGLIFVVRGMSLVKEFRLGIADRPVAFGQDCKGLVAQPGIEPLYLAFAVREMSDRIHGMVELAGHGTGKLSTDRLQALVIPLPPTDLQSAFVNVVGPMREQMSTANLERKIAQRLKDQLLPPLVSGTIDGSHLDVDGLITV